jgi:YVTN family beta-propeller protein
MGKFANIRAGLLVSVVITAAVVHLVFAQDAKPDKTAPPTYLSPIAMVADKAGKTIYIAQATAGQIAVFDVATRKVTANIDIGLPVSGVAISPDGTTLYVTAGGAEGKLCIVDIKNRKVAARIPVGHTPMSPILTKKGTVYVCNRFDNTICLVDLAAGKSIRTFGVPNQPVSVDLSKDGSILLVANHLPAGPASAEHVAAEITIIYTRNNKDPVTLKLPSGSTNLRGIRVSPDGKYAAVTHCLARRMRETALESLYKNIYAISLIDVSKRCLINTVLVDDVSSGAANPWALAWSADSKRLCVTHAGTHEISVIDFPALEAKLSKAAAEKQDQNVQNGLSFLVGLRKRIKLPGKGPRCITLIDNKAFVGEYFTDSLSMLDISGKLNAKDKPKVESIALGPKTAMTAIRRGEMLFNDANISFQSWLSCATCHPDGRTEGLNWDFVHDGIDNSKNTKSLIWAHKTPPMMSNGKTLSRKSNLKGYTKPLANARTTIRYKIRFSLYAVRPEKDVTDIYEYLTSLRPTPSPHLVNGKLSPAAQRGKLLFHNKAKCNTCHSGEFFTDQKEHNVTGKAADTPTLIETWRTAPYLYKGQTATILEILSHKRNPKDLHGETAKLSPREKLDLAEYVLSL